MSYNSCFSCWGYLRFPFRCSLSFRTSPSYPGFLPYPSSSCHSVFLAPVLVFFHFLSPVLFACLPFTLHLPPLPPLGKAASCILDLDLKGFFSSPSLFKFSVYYRVLKKKKREKRRVFPLNPWHTERMVVLKEMTWLFIIKLRGLRGINEKISWFSRGLILCLRVRRRRLIPWFEAKLPRKLHSYSNEIQRSTARAHPLVRHARLYLRPLTYYPMGAFVVFFAIGN